MPARVSIVLPTFFAIHVAGSNFGNGMIFKVGRIAWAWLAVDRLEGSRRPASNHAQAA
jgi:hypothetical protein